jgi:predicted YcjX-like family ATPase
MPAIKTPQWISEVQQAAGLGVQHLRVGVTGLSRAGKTTFITSLINQLENHQRGLLARRSPFDRLEAVRWQRDGVQQPFAYLQALDSLSGDPARWPASTTDLSRVVIDLRFRQTGLLKRLQQNRSLRLEILDYPGEWLLDLPLMELEYGQWCEQMRDWLSAEPRRSLAGPLREELASIDPQAPQDLPQIQRLTAAWTEFLQRSRSEAGLSRNQPGRFLLPGSGVAADMLLFVPLLAGNRHTSAPTGSAWAECEARFRYYRDFVVKGFYDEHFSRLDRQVLLVDMPHGCRSSGID